MHEKLFDSELRLMDILWDNGALPAKQVAVIAENTIGWNKNTTYTVLKKLAAKGFLRRDEPHFLCTPLVTREQMQKAETGRLLGRLFGGSRRALFSALLEEEPLSTQEIDDLRALIDQSGEK